MIKKVFSSSSIRALARERLKNEKTDSKLTSGKVILNSDLKLIDKSKSGFDPLRYVQEESKNSQAWAENLDTAKVLVLASQDDADGTEEIYRLCETLGLVVEDSFLLKKRFDPAASTFLPLGMIEKVLNQMQAIGCGTLVVNLELSASQVRNLEKKLKVPVLDRQGVILAIFERHARTRLAKMQVELAQLKYYSARLSGLWMGLSRQRGGRGGLRGRGSGETQLELDRRTVRNRIHLLQSRLKHAESVFQTQAAKRKNLSRVALVGYTNAGKSSLMARLTQTNVKAEDKLFSTLDTTVKSLQPPTQPKVLISDTVGFIKNLPHDLVASFKSTLQELLESNLLLLVVDVSSPTWFEHLETTIETLKEIGASDQLKVLIFNKTDRLKLSSFLKSSIQKKANTIEEFKSFCWVSAKTGEGLNQLRELIMNKCQASNPDWLANVSHSERGEC